MPPKRTPTASVNCYSVVIPGASYGVPLTRIGSEVLPRDSCAQTVAPAGKKYHFAISAVKAGRRAGYDDSAGKRRQDWPSGGIGCGVQVCRPARWIERGGRASGVVCRHCLPCPEPLRCSQSHLHADAGPGLGRGRGHAIRAKPPGPRASPQKDLHHGRDGAGDQRRLFGTGAERH